MYDLKDFPLREYDLIEYIMKQPIKYETLGNTFAHQVKKKANVTEAVGG